MRFDNLKEEMVVCHSQDSERGDNARRQARNLVAIDIFRITEEMEDPAEAYYLVMKIRRYLCGNKETP